MRAGSFSMSETANGMTSVRFSVDSTDGSYRPAVDSEVTITVDGTLVFGGFVDRPTEKGIGNIAGSKPAIRTEISATDYSQYPQRRVIPDGGFPAGYTLLQALTALMTWLTPFGVTLDPAQVTGPTLPELVYKYKPVSDVLNELATISGGSGEPFVWRISPAKVFGMYQASTIAAPFNVTTNTPSQVVGDITVDSNQQYYANRIYLKTPDKTEAGRIETFTGDGSTTSFTTLYTPTKTYGTVGTTSNPNETLNNTGDADAATWTYDATTKTITRNDGAPTIGEVISFKFDGTYSGAAIAEDAAVFTRPWERVKTVENVPDDTTLQALADAELARCLPLTKTVKYATFESGLRPGQTQTINVPRRNINDTGIITDVNTRDVGKDRLLRDVTVLFDAQTNVGRDFRATIKQWSGDTNGGAAASSVAGPATPTAGGAAPPITSVQFNRAGRFGGKSTFTFIEGANTLIAGGPLNTITAAAYQHVQMFGDDNHLTD